MKLMWDELGERLYETGTDMGVLYVMTDSGAYGEGEAWNGLTGVSENPSGADSSKLYANNSEYLNMISKEEFAYTIEAYAYPESFMQCDGSAALTAGVYAGQQARKKFGFAFRSRVGNDVEDTEHGYKLHLCYNGNAAPSQKGFTTINDSPEAITFSWEVSTTPVKLNTKVDGKTLRPMATIIIDSTLVDAAKLASFEEILYGKDPTTEGGSDGVIARLPSPDEVLAHFTA